MKVTIQMRALAVVVAAGLATALGCARVELDGASDEGDAKSAPGRTMRTAINAGKWGTSYRWVGYYLLPPGADQDIFSNPCPRPRASDYKKYISAKPLFDYAALLENYVRELGEDQRDFVAKKLQALATVDSFAGTEPRAGRFCVYEYDDRADNRKTVPPSAGTIIASLPSNSDGTLGSKWLAQDVMAMVPQEGACSDLGPQELSDALSSRLFEWARVESGASVASWPYTDDSVTTHVAVLDTVPDASERDGYPMEITNRHGHGIISWIKALACPDNSPNCPVQVDAYLALDLELDTTTQPPSIAHNSERGGNFGYHSTLAHKIFEAVADWKILRPETKQIINLSVGAEPHITGMGPNSPVWDSLTSALEHAACHGAITAAAAGNHPGGGASYYLPGPTIPGLGETIAAPAVDPGTGLACEATEPGQSLVTMTAFGAGPELPISVTRDDGISSIGAFAQQIPINSRYLRAGATESVFDGYNMTGTSMAAATASAAAAVLSALDVHNGLARGKAMREHIYENAVSFIKQVQYAEFYLDTGIAAAPEAKRISICNAVRDLPEVANGPEFLCDGALGLNADNVMNQAASCIQDAVVSESFRFDAPLAFSEEDDRWYQIDASDACGPGARLDVLMPEWVEPTLAGYRQHLIEAHHAEAGDVSLCPVDELFTANVGEYDFPQPRIPDPGGGTIVFHRFDRSIRIVPNASFVDQFDAGEQLTANVTLRFYRGRILVRQSSLQFSFEAGEPILVENVVPENYESASFTSGTLTGTVRGVSDRPHAIAIEFGIANNN